MYFCWIGVLNDLTHLGDFTAEESPLFRIRENRGMEDTTMTKGINAIFDRKS